MNNIKTEQTYKETHRKLSTFYKYRNTYNVPALSALQIEAIAHETAENGHPRDLRLIDAIIIGL